MSAQCDVPDCGPKQVPTAVFSCLSCQHHSQSFLPIKLATYWFSSVSYKSLFADPLCNVTGPRPPKPTPQLLLMFWCGLEFSMGTVYVQQLVHLLINFKVIIRIPPRPYTHPRRGASLWTEKFDVDKKNQLDVTFCILYLSSNSCSTCFGQPCAHHQELTTALCYSLVLVCAVAAGRLSRPVGSRCHFLYSLFLF